MNKCIFQLRATPQVTPKYVKIHPLFWKQGQEQIMHDDAFHRPNS
jgi:hypothetical protein